MKSETNNGRKILRTTFSIRCGGPGRNARENGAFHMAFMVGSSKGCCWTLGHSGFSLPAASAPFSEVRYRRLRSQNSRKEKWDLAQFISNPWS